ncbi:MAG: cell division protein FtsQ/DivIB [Minisyncoccota bacterium]
MKIVSSSKGIHTPEFHKKKLREKYIRLTIGILILIVIIGVPTYLLRQERFLISNVQVQGNDITKSEEIEKIIQGHISGNYLWLIPRSSVLLYPNKKIRNDILEQIPRLISMHLSLTDSRTLLVTILERKPFALYCTNLASPPVRAGCFFLDQSGYIFSEAPAFSGEVYMIYSTEPPLENPLRKNLVPEKDFRVLSDFIKRLPTLDLKPQSLLIQNDAYRLTFSSGGILIWKVGDNLDSVFSKLESFLIGVIFTKEHKALSDILYIDMRFGDKVRYNFK